MTLNDQEKQTFTQVEKMMLPFMMDLLLQHGIKQGYQFRQDMFTLVEKANRNAVEDVNFFVLNRAAPLVQKEGYEVLKEARENNAQILLAGFALMVMRRAKDGFPVDPDIFLLCSGVAAELQEDERSWGPRAAIQSARDKIDAEALVRGFFKAPPPKEEPKTKLIV